MMITPDFVRTMAAYNAEMNRRLYDAAARLPDAERRRDRGAFWRSIHGTLCHLVWGDSMWMARFDGWEKPTVPLRQSAEMVADFDDMGRMRVALDAKLVAWGERLDAAWLAQDQTWFSGAAQREMRRPRTLLVAHFFNHQTHHRGQAHAMLTAAGEQTGDTDLMLLA
jgi:uncharacterized damage-inducible protein DinB